MAEEKEDDFIGKRVNDGKKIFGMVKEDVKSAVIVFLIFVLGWQLWRNDKLTDRLINDNSRLNELRLADFKKMVQQVVGEKLPEEVAKQNKPLKEKVDTTIGKIDKIIEEVIK